MKNLFKALLTIAVFSSAFCIGFYLGQEKIASRIPKFQEEHEDLEETA